MKILKIFLYFVRVLYALILICFGFSIFVLNSIDYDFKNIFSFWNIIFIISFCLIFLSLILEKKSKKWLLLGLPVALFIIVYFSVAYVYDKNLSKEAESQNYNSLSKINEFDFFEIKKDMLNSKVTVQILLPRKMKFETDGKKISATYQVLEEGGYKVDIFELDSDNNYCSAEACIKAYFGAEKYDNKPLGEFGWEKVFINNSLEGYYFNESPRVAPILEFVYEDTLYTFQIKGMDKEESISIVKDILFMNNVSDSVLEYKNKSREEQVLIA